MPAPVHLMFQWVCSIFDNRPTTTLIDLIIIIIIIIEPYNNPSTRTLQFYVKDELGALAGALKAFRVSHYNEGSSNIIILL